GRLDLCQDLAEAGNGKNLKTGRGSGLSTAHDIGRRRPVDESQIFTDALKLATAGERAAYLDKACTGNPKLRAAVEALLQAHSSAPGFLERPVGSFSDTLDSPTASTASPPPEAAGMLIAGRYKLVEQIGEGGMGKVWMAQQAEPVRRLVAVKLIKRGMDS